MALEHGLRIAAQNTFFFILAKAYTKAIKMPFFTFQIDH